MALLEHQPQPAKGSRLRAQDPALEDFRAQMGAWVEGRSDREVAELKAFLDTVAHLALENARQRA